MDVVREAIWGIRNGPNMPHRSVPAPHAAWLCASSEIRRKCRESSRHYIDRELFRVGELVSMQAVSGRPSLHASLSVEQLRPYPIST